MTANIYTDFDKNDVVNVAELLLAPGSARLSAFEDVYSAVVKAERLVNERCHRARSARTESFCSAV